MCEGIADELRGIDLGDQRLNQRSKRVIEALAANPESSLAVTPDKLCLGVVGTESFDRAAESLGKAEERTTLPIEAKERFRWLTGYRLACQWAAECPATQIVSVADREADIYDIFVDAPQQCRPSPKGEYYSGTIKAFRCRWRWPRDLRATASASHAFTHLPSTGAAGMLPRTWPR